MVFAHVFSLARRWWLALASVVLLVSADVAAAQQLRGPPIALRPSTFQPVPQPGVGSAPYGPYFGVQGNNQPPGNQVFDRYSAALMPGKPQIPLLNNGSLQITQNSFQVGTPNVQPFTYIAALPIGDRLGKNGIFYDPDLDTNIGFTPNSLTTPNYPGPIQPYPFQAINGNAFARQRLMAAAMYSPSFSAFTPYPMYNPYASALSMYPMYSAMMAAQSANFGYGLNAANPVNGNVYGNVPVAAFGGFAPIPDANNNKNDKANP